MADAHESGPGGTLAGTTIEHGKYELVAELGRGGMGVVYEALHRDLGRRVAVKILHERVLHIPNVTERFKREAQAASRLLHPNSVQILDFGIDGDTHYIVMEYLDGRNLYDLIHAEGPLDEPRIVYIASQVCSALMMAHELGVVHRDLKPENIQLVSGIDDDGRPIEMVKVCDFGLAKLMTREARTDSEALTIQGEICGTPEYMSPEQVRGDPLGPPADIYSCGVILFHMATGRLPFEAESMLGVLMRHLSEAPPLASKVNPRVSGRLAAIIQRAMAKAPEERQAGAKELRGELRALVGDIRNTMSLPVASFTAPRAEGSSGQSAPWPPARSHDTVLVSASRVEARPRRRRWPLVLLAACLLGGAALATLWALRGGERDAVATAREPAAAPPPGEPAVTVAATMPSPDAGAGPGVRRADATGMGAGVGDTTTPAGADAGADAEVEGPEVDGSDGDDGQRAVSQKKKRKKRRGRRSRRKRRKKHDWEADEGPIEAAPAPSAPAVATEPGGVLEARVRLESAQVHGALDREDVMRAFTAKRGALANCYRAAAAKAGHGQSTKIMISALLTAEGRPTEVKASESGLPGLSECVRDAVKRVRVASEGAAAGSTYLVVGVRYTPR